MKILIVEDDENKRWQLDQLVHDCFSTAEIHYARSLQSGLRWMRKETAALILLDMTLPTFDIGPGETGGRTHAFGGREFLREMRRFKITTPVIVVTQFETFGSGGEVTTLTALDSELRRDYAGVYQGAVYYHAAVESWKEQLKKLILRLAEA
jgi:CheY-like chemotaxis protein